MPKFHNKFTIVALASVAVLSGCSTFTSKEMSVQVTKEIKSTTASITANNKRVIESKVVDSSYVKGTLVDYIAPDKGSISLHIVQQPLFGVLQGLAEQAKYAVSVASDVNATKLITVDLRAVTHEQAMRDVASAAGYIVVFDHARKTVTLTDTATYTFRLPSRLFNDSLASKFKMSNTPGGGGSSEGALSTTTSADVSGGSIKQSGAAIEKFVKELAGANADVQVMPDAGLITVRTKAQQLKRIHQSLTDYAKFSLTQVELEVSMMEVTLGDDTSSGVDWKQILNVAGVPVTFGINGSLGGAPTASMQYSGATVQSLVNVLEKTTNAKTLARQRFPAFNNTVAMMFDGKQVPYIGKVQQSVAGSSGTATTTGEFSYAMDGISTAVYTNVLDNNQVELTLMPVLSSIEGFESATIGGNTIKAPILPLRQGHFPFIGKHGQTLVFGGGRYGRSSENNNGLPGLTGTALNKLAGTSQESLVQKELVFLVNTKIIPMTNFEPLVRESM